MTCTAVRTIPGEITLPRPAVGGLGPIRTLGLLAVTVETDAGLAGEFVLITLSNGRYTEY